MEQRLKAKMTPCQQMIYNTISHQLACGVPSITIIDAMPGSGLSTLMERLKSLFGATCLYIATRPALSGLNLLDACYYELGLIGENIAHRAPIPAYVTSLVSLRPITIVCIEDIDDFAVTLAMKKITVAHLSKLTTAWPNVHFVISQSLLRSAIDCSIRHRDIIGCHERNEYYLQSFTGESQYIVHLTHVIEVFGLDGVTDVQLSELHERTQGNLALTMLNLCHPLLRKQRGISRWSQNE